MPKPPPEEQYMLAQMQEMRRQLQASQQREAQKKVCGVLWLIQHEGNMQIVVRGVPPGGLSAVRSAACCFSARGSAVFMAN